MSGELSPLRLQDVGEQGLLQRLYSFCPSGVVGDDAALLPVDGEKSLVVTADMLVDGVHFSDQTTSPVDAGWRAAAANLSDLAAMGAEPLGITVCLGLPRDVLVSWVEQLYQGITTCLRQYNTPIVGGDVCRSRVITIAITAFGQVNPVQAIRRALAHPGDAILVTGVHGASRAGLELLLHPEQGQDLSEGDRTTLIQAHQRPNPRLDVIPLLQEAFDLEAWLNRKMNLNLGAVSPRSNSPLESAMPPMRVAGMDSSDGLADAVLQICRASGVGARLERNQIPIPFLKGWLSEEQTLEWALYGGEDFELVLCLPMAIAQTLKTKLGNSAAIVGTITTDLDIVLQDSNGRYPEQILNFNQGFQHF
jgi:thiamine-monophosphate kinase